MKPYKICKYTDELNILSSSLFSLGNSCLWKISLLIVGLNWFHACQFPVTPWTEPMILHLTMLLPWSCPWKGYRPQLIYLRAMENTYRCLTLQFQSIIQLLNQPVAKRVANSLMGWESEIFCLLSSHANIYLRLRDQQKLFTAHSYHKNG